MKSSCPGSAEIKSPFPEDLICIFCSHTNEIWSDEIEMECKKCGKKISRDMKNTCIEWCGMARECIGNEKYDKLMQYFKNKKKS